MEYFKRLKTSGCMRLEAFKMYYMMRASAPSLHRESTDSLICMLFTIQVVRVFVVAIYTTVYSYTQPYQGRI